MTRREALQDLQSRLADRLAVARTEHRGASFLAVEVAGLGLLFPLADAGEIFPATDVLPLAHTQPWFCGVANLRGGLHGVVDLGVFLGLRARPLSDAVSREAMRLLALSPTLGSMCALRVDRLAGLRGADQLSAEPAVVASRPAFAAGRWRDPQGRVWQEIDLAALTANERFLAVAH